jgi:aminoglycoside/choline kinase family phosphotransferase
VVDRAEDLTTEWLSRALCRRVRSFDAQPIGTGQMGSSWRIALTYDGDPGPATVVAKLAAGPEAARSQVAPGFAKEVGFYTELAPTLDVRTPHCFYGAIAADKANFTLLLEDLAPATPGVQADSCTVEQASGAVGNLAALHASRWNDSRLREHQFLSPVIPDQSDLVAAVLGPATDEFLARYGEQLGDQDAATLHAAAAGIGAWVRARPEPFAVVHGDYRLDNLMFPPTGDDVAALDWQSVSVGPPGRDLAYFVGTTFEAAERRRHEDALVAAYHSSLVARGVVGYDFGRCYDDYRLGRLQGPLITVLGAVYATAERSESADRMFLAMARRSCAAIRDLRSLELLG